MNKMMSFKTEKEQLKAIKQYGGWVLSYITKPSEKVQLTAVRQSGHAIIYIKNPSEKVQLAAIKQNENAILNINNPSEKTQLEVVKKDGYLICYIKNPSKETQLEAIKQCSNILNKTNRYIKNPCQEVLDLAMIKDIIE